MNLQSSDYNITATSALTQIGFLEHTQRSRKALIEDLSRYHFFRLGEIDGKIKTIAESFTVVGTIDIDNLRAHNSEEEMPGYDVDVTIKEDHLLPKEVKVSVMDPALEYHNETAASQLFTGISGTESVEYTFSIVDPASEARNRAERLLLKAYSENIEYEFFAMPSEAKYSIGDIIQAPVNGINYRMRIESKQMTLPIGAIKFRCVSISPFTPTVYQDNVTSLATRAGDQFARDSFPRNSIVLPIWSEPIREADKGRLGVYLAVSGRGRGFGSSASLYREIADEYFELQKAGIPFSPMGISASTLPSHVVGEDGTNQLDVWFFDDVSLESVTSGDITRYPLVNLLRIGNEWIRFRDAAALTLEDNSPYGSKWRLTNLYRGQFGTESAAGTSKAAGEYAALVTPSLQFYELEQEDIGQFVTLKAVTVGQDIDVAPETSFVFAGANTTPSLSLADLPVMTSAQFATKISDETGTAGKLVFSTSPVLVAPILGTPNSGNLINCTGFPAAALSGMASWMPSFSTKRSTPNICH